MRKRFMRDCGVAFVKGGKVWGVWYPKESMPMSLAEAEAERKYNLRQECATEMEFVKRMAIEPYR